MPQEQLLLRNVPADLKLALMQAAEYGQTNMQAIAVGILAEHFKVKYQPTHNRGLLANPENTTMNLRLPPELHRKLRIASAGDGVANADKALQVIGEKLGIEISPDHFNRRGANKRALRAQKEETTA